MSDKLPLPQSEGDIATIPGHWFLARMGKRVLRPGGLKLTQSMLAHAHITDEDVVELAPGMGRTAQEILQLNPKSYTGVDKDPRAKEIVSALVSSVGTCITADASDTTLPNECADVVIGEAMLTMQDDTHKQRIIQEALRLLRPGGRYVIHELGLSPEDIDQEKIREIQADLAREIRVGARPMTRGMWEEYLSNAGFVIDWAQSSPMHLLEPARMLADEGLLGMLTVIKNIMLTPGAKKRMMSMKRMFASHQDNLCGVALVAHKPR